MNTIIKVKYTGNCKTLTTGKVYEAKRTKAWNGNWFLRYRVISDTGKPYYYSTKNFVEVSA